MSKWLSETFVRIVIGLLCIVLTGMGAAHLLRGEFLYPNYFGDAVFPGLAVLVGLAGLVAAFFLPIDSNRPSRSKKEAKARRRLKRKKRANIRFPWDDYQKW